MASPAGPVLAALLALRYVANRRNPWRIVWRATGVNRNTAASDPGGVRLSLQKLKAMHPYLYRPVLRGAMGWWYAYSFSWADRWEQGVQAHLQYGDSRAAVVLRTSPLLIAAYSDETDGIALLRFPDALTGAYGLSPGSRLLTVNTYLLRNLGVAKDLLFGPGDHGRYGNFIPFIAEFLSNDTERITERKAQIPEAEWERAARLGEEYIALHGSRARDGRPLYCHLPA